MLLCEGGQTHLSKKTQRHVDRELIAPPIIGPHRREMAYTMLRLAVYFAYFSGGTSSSIMAVLRA